jgi:hypothetical protein
MAPGCCLEINVLQEFVAQATRASRIEALSAAEARALIDRWSRFTVQPIVREVFQRVFELQCLPWIRA